MQPIQDRLQASQDRPIERNREWALETWLMLRLRKQPLQFDQLDLEVQFPATVISTGRMVYHRNIHGHEVLNRLGHRRVDM